MSAKSKVSQHLKDTKLSFQNQTAVRDQCLSKVHRHQRYQRFLLTVCRNEALKFSLVPVSNVNSEVQLD